MIQLCKFKETRIAAILREGEWINKHKNIYRNKCKTVVLSEQVKNFFRLHYMIDYSVNLC